MDWPEPKLKTMMEAVEPGRTEADLVSIGLPDTVGTVRGYDCDMARSTCVGGAPTEAQLTVLEQAIEFVETLVDAVAPGVTHEQVHDVGTAWMVERGYPSHAYFEGFWPVFGHQLGLSVEGPTIGAGATEEIVPGQVLAIEIVMGRRRPAASPTRRSSSSIPTATRSSPPAAPALVVS